MSLFHEHPSRRNKSCAKSVCRGIIFDTNIFCEDLHRRLVEETNRVLNLCPGELSSTPTYSVNIQLEETNHASNRCVEKLSSTNEMWIYQYKRYAQISSWFLVSATNAKSRSRQQSIIRVKEHVSHVVNNG
jgi:hypothetical protein